MDQAVPPIIVGDDCDVSLYPEAPDVDAYWAFDATGRKLDVRVRNGFVRLLATDQCIPGKAEELLGTHLRAIGIHIEADERLTDLLAKAGLLMRRLR